MMYGTYPLRQTYETQHTATIETYSACRELVLASIGQTDETTMYTDSVDRGKEKHMEIQVKEAASLSR